MTDQRQLVEQIWKITALFQSSVSPSRYSRVILPMVLLRRVDCVLASTKEQVLARLGSRPEPDENLFKITGVPFYNVSPLNLEIIIGDPGAIASNLAHYIRSFSPRLQQIFQDFGFNSVMDELNDEGLLFVTVAGFCAMDLSPEKISGDQMAAFFEGLIQRFVSTMEINRTPRDVVQLMVQLLFENERDRLKNANLRLLDPACGTGGMLLKAQEYLKDCNPAASLRVFGQDIDPQALAIATSMQLLMNIGGEIRKGNSLTQDQFSGETFDYFLSNPPFGFAWKKQQKQIQEEHERLGYKGRFGAGLPRISDSALLFAQHMLSKFESSKACGSRLAILLSGGSLFVGNAGTGESDIRRWIIENDWLETIVALPGQLFYETGIETFIWILTNRKTSERKGKIQLLDARELSLEIRSQGKRRHLGQGKDGEPNHIAQIIDAYQSFEESEISKICQNESFGYTEVVIEQPLRLTYQMTSGGKARLLNAVPHLLDDLQMIDEALGREPHHDWNKVSEAIRKLLAEKGSHWKAHEKKLFRSVFCEVNTEAEPVKVSNGYEPDPKLRQTDYIPLKDDIDKFFKRKIQPYLPKAWLDRSRDEVGYEIAFNGFFITETPQRSLEEIDAELEIAKAEVIRLMGEVIK